jgi:hypothetical protein
MYLRVRELTLNRKLMLSIGKLTHLAQMQEDTAVDESMLDGMIAVTLRT